MWQIWDFFKICFSEFWLGEIKCTETDLKKSQICPILGQSVPIWQAKIYWNWSLKDPDLSHFGPIWSNLASQHVLKLILKSPRFVHIGGKFDSIRGQPWHSMNCNIKFHKFIIRCQIKSPVSNTDISDSLYHQFLKSYDIITVSEYLHYSIIYPDLYPFQIHQFWMKSFNIR